MKNNRLLGAYYEELAARFLSAQGYQITDRNVRCRKGEADLVARESGYLVFIEVKYRSTANFGMPAEAVGVKKQRRIAVAAAYYMMREGLSECPVRFDVVEILGKKIRVMKHAFTVSI